MPSFCIPPYYWYDLKYITLTHNFFHPTTNSWKGLPCNCPHLNSFSYLLLFFSNLYFFHTNSVTNIVNLQSNWHKYQFILPTPEFKPTECLIKHYITYRYHYLIYHLQMCFSNLQLDCCIHRYDFEILYVATKELINQIQVLLSALMNTTEETHLFPKQSIKRIMWKIDELLYPTFDKIPPPATEPVSKNLNPRLNQIYIESKNALQKLIILRGNVLIADKQFVSPSYFLLTMIKKEEPYYSERAPHIIDALQIALVQSVSLHKFSKENLSIIDTYHLC